ncbi:MAG: protein-glutamine glutaminase family protein [Bdellovibrionales bacterium]
MMQKSFFLVLMLVSSISWGLSAVRKPGEDWRKKAQGRARTFDHTIQVFNETPLEQSRPLKKVDFAEVPDVENKQNVMTIFRYIRDTRFIRDVATPKNQRRISWMYPDDGCYVRAEMMTSQAEMRGWPSMKKLFIFGNLAAQTRNTPEGVVRWWYHVAPVVRTGDKVWVLDPSLDFQKPLGVIEWRNRMRAEGDLPEHFSLCDAHTFDPDFACQNPKRRNYDGVVGWQKIFLEEEWRRILELGRDPYREL